MIREIEKIIHTSVLHSSDFGNALTSLIIEAMHELSAVNYISYSKKRITRSTTKIILKFECPY